MRRIVLWLMSTLTALVLLFGYHTSTSTSTSTSSTAAADAESSVVSPAQSGTGTTSAGTGSTAGTTSAPSGSSATSATVTGDSASTRWGPVQVQLTVADGTITAVDVVEFPTGNGKDREINARALPILVQETLDAQSSDIDMVSGATVTSEGYRESLQSALDQAGL
jgi:uncharacterized protein with FMN-binding domain